MCILPVRRAIFTLVQASRTQLYLIQTPHPVQPGPFIINSSSHIVCGAPSSSARHTFINWIGTFTFLVSSSFLRGMYQLSDLALEAILKEWHPQEYDPPHTDIREWIHSVEALCDTYGVPDLQRPQCATRFIKDELSAELMTVLMEAQAKFGPVRWDRFKAFMTAYDRKRDSIVVELPLTESRRGIPGAMGG